MPSRPDSSRPPTFPSTSSTRTSTSPSSTSRPGLVVHPGAGPLGRHPGQRAGGARHDAVGRRGGPPGHRAPARPRHLGPDGGGQDRPGAPAAGAMLAAPADHARATRRSAWGHLDESPTVIEAPLARHPHDRKRMTVATGGPPVADRCLRGRPVRAGRPAAAGAAHRAHPPDPGAPGAHRAPGGRRPGLRRRGQPADVRARRGLPAEALERLAPRQALHAAWLAFRHPVTGEPLEFRAEWPADLAAAAGSAAWALETPLLRLRLFAIFISLKTWLTPPALRARVFRLGPAGLRGCRQPWSGKILPRVRPTRIPGAPAAVGGLVNVRGRLLTVVDGRRAARAAPLPEHERVDPGAGPGRPARSG